MKIVDPLCTLFVLAFAGLVQCNAAANAASTLSSTARKPATAEVEIGVRKPNASGAADWEEFGVSGMIAIAQ
jgi:hypothetical protein